MQNLSDLLEPASLKLDLEAEKYLLANAKPI